MQISATLQKALTAVRPLPFVAHRVLAVIQDPDFEIDELIALVRADPSLVSRVLRLCNSARNGLAAEVTAVADAVAYIGTRHLVQLVLVSCSSELFTDVRRSRYTSAESSWRHSLWCAVLGQLLAARVPGADGGTAFTAGILHNLGKLALAVVADDSKFAAAMKRLVSGRVTDVNDVERAAFGVDHAAAAGLVAAAAHLPRAIVQALRDHHDPAALAGSDPLPAILHVADRIALQQGVDNPFAPAAVACDAAAMQRLGFDPTAPGDLDDLTHL